MKEKLPKVFANKIEKNIKNNEEIYLSKTKSEEKQQKPTSPKKETLKIEKTMQQKINAILNSKAYTYKIPVKIILKNDEKIITNIIGKNKQNLITIENKLIKIEDIIDIKKQEKNE